PGRPAPATRLRRGAVGSWARPTAQPPGTPARPPALLLLAPLAAPAARAPKETNDQALPRLFGTAVDPNKDCEFAFDGKKLTVKAGKGDHALQVSGGRAGAPRTLREVEGDFTAEVTAAPGVRPPGAKPAMEGRLLKFYSQGLLLW